MKGMLKTITRVAGKDAKGQKTRAGKDLKTPKRKRVGSPWKDPRWIVAGVAASVAALGGAGMWVAQSGLAARVADGLHGETVQVFAEMGFTVQDVLVEGRGETRRADLLRAVDVRRGTPILAVDLDAAKARVEALDWVRQARVERLLPDTLMVRITERRPLALWQNKGRFSLIDEDGVVITQEGLGRFSHLMHVVGEDAPENVAGLLELLDTQPDLKSKVKAAVRVGGRRWDLALNGGVDVRLPEENPSEALVRLADFEQRNDVLSREVKVLDLRQPDRIIVRHDGKTQPASFRSNGRDT
ncbi:MAG: cell division protein FtsQ/DivIB [Alphaproteobacteria bacterium]|nr:cell division protein FtsQ/DivIB [Alphaproteobacteria bacterium]